MNTLLARRVTFFCRGAPNSLARPERASDRPRQVERREHLRPEGDDVDEGSVLDAEHVEGQREVGGISGALDVVRDRPARSLTATLLPSTRVLSIATVLPSPT
jgi:hypothetical protein